MFLYLYLLNVNDYHLNCARLPPKNQFGRTIMGTYVFAFTANTLLYLYDIFFVFIYLFIVFVIERNVANNKTQTHIHTRKCKTENKL